MNDSQRTLAELDSVATTDCWPMGSPAPNALVVQILYEVARYCGCVAATGSPFAIALRERIANPQPGDWVVESTKFQSDSVAVFVGRLWDMDHPDGKEQDPINFLWRCRSAIDGQFYNWSNAEFIALPTRAIRDAVSVSLRRKA